MLAVNESMQRDGNPGFETLAMFRFDQRVDMERLRVSLDEIGKRHPILTARLIRNGLRRWFWKWQDSGEIPLRSERLTSGNDEGLLARAGELLSHQRTLQHEPPIEVHVLHLTDGSDTLFVQVNHSLMDHRSLTLFLHELDHAYTGEEFPELTSDEDAIGSYHRRVPQKRRRRALRRMLPTFVRDRWSSRKSWPRQLPIGNVKRYAKPHRLGVRIHSLGTDLTNGLMQTAKQTVSLSSISMTLLGAVYGAFERLLDDPKTDDLYRTAIGVEVGIQHSGNFHPQNASSILRLELSSSELRDRGSQRELLVSRFRDALGDEHDLGLLVAAARSRSFYPLVRRVTGQMIRHAFSFWYAYFAIPTEWEEKYLGLPVRQVAYLGPAWTPLGITLLITKSCGQFHLALTYVVDQVGDRTAAAFLDLVLDELRNLLKQHDSKLDING